VDGRYGLTAAVVRDGRHVKVLCLGRPQRQSRRWRARQVVPSSLGPVRWFVRMAGRANRSAIGRLGTCSKTLAAAPACRGSSPWRCGLPAPTGCGARGSRIMRSRPRWGWPVCAALIACSITTRR
jgi:hypothetical protein